MSCRRNQSRMASLVEALANVLVGYGVALGAQQLVFPAFGILTSLAEDSAIAALFTLVSLARSYLLRRLFERIGTGRRTGPRLRPGVYRIVAEDV